MSRQQPSKPKPHDNNNNDNDDEEEEPPLRGGFADVFRQNSTGANIDELMSSQGGMMASGSGLPESSDSLTQSRAPHGNEAAGATRSLLMESRPEARSISMMSTTPAAESILSESPFQLHPGPAAAAPPPMKGIVEPNEDFYGFKFAQVANLPSEPTTFDLNDVLDNPFAPASAATMDKFGPTMGKTPPKQEKPPSKVRKITLTLEQQAQLIPNPTKVTYTPPSLSGTHITNIGSWGPSGSGACFVRYLPGIYPNRAKIIRDCAFPFESLPEKTRQIQIYNKTLGFQVIYQENPLRATVQTPDCGEFIVDFWVSSSKNDFYLALYAQREVGIETQVQMDLLLQALKEETIVNMPLPTRQPFDRNSLERLEKYLDSSVQAMEAAAAKTSTSTTSTTALQQPNVLAEIHEGLMSDSWERRKLAMSLLLHGTDLKSTLGSFACKVASVVLAGASLDQAELDHQRALEIHKTLIHILQEAEFVGDVDLLLQDYGGDDFKEEEEEEADKMMTDHAAFHSNNNYFTTRKRPQFYEDYMSDLQNMAMTILVQALEVAVCFEQHKDLIQQFVTNYYLTTSSSSGGGAAMNKVLERCIFQVNDPLARHSLSKGYMACKALRILVESNSELRKQVGLDDRTKSSILGALQVGESSHWLLHRESKDLHNLIYNHHGQML